MIQWQPLNSFSLIKISSPTPHQQPHFSAIGRHQAPLGATGQGPTAPLGATGRHQPKTKFQPVSALIFLRYLILFLSTNHLSIQISRCLNRHFFHVWAFQGFTHYLGEGESVMHKSIGFFYPCGYTIWILSDDEITTFEFIYVSNEFAPYPHQQPHFSATGRHWAPPAMKWSLTVGPRQKKFTGSDSAANSFSSSLHTGWLLVLVKWCTQTNVIVGHYTLPPP
jgi:hypothetical protein